MTIAAVLIFFGAGVSFAGSVVDDEGFDDADEGVGDVDALIICGVDAGEAGVLFDSATELDPTDEAVDTDDDVDNAEEVVEDIADPV
ncbi:hypothetical protein PMIN04_002411 [Paraphaeosphaeria minitans]